MSWNIISLVEALVLLGFSQPAFTFPQAILSWHGLIMACQSMRARRWRTHSQRKSSYSFALFVFVKEGNGRWSINGVKTRVYDTRRIKQRTSEWRILDETAKRKYCLFNLTHVLFCLDSFSFNFVLFLFVCLHQVALLRGRRYSAFLEPIQLISSSLSVAVGRNF